MTNKKHKVKTTDASNLISNLRGEIGEVVSSWVLLRFMKTEYSQHQTSDIAMDISNPILVFYGNLIDKLEDEIIARLSELAEKKVGRLTFYFVKEKIGFFDTEVADFIKFVSSNGFTRKRNYDISHKEIPEKWEGHKYIHIPYEVINKGVVLALILMKKIDLFHLGPSSPYLWKEMRKRRYKLTSPASAGYLLLPYFWPSIEDRKKILSEELTAGIDVWQEANVKVNGIDRNIHVCGKWGALKIDQIVMLLPDSFIQISEINLQAR